MQNLKDLLTAAKRDLTEAQGRYARTRSLLDLRELQEADDLVKSLLAHQQSSNDANDPSAIRRESLARVRSLTGSHPIVAPSESRPAKRRVVLKRTTRIERFNS